MSKVDKPRGIQRRAPRPAPVDPDSFINAAQGSEPSGNDPIEALTPAEPRRKSRTVTFNLRLSEEQHAMLDAVSQATNRSKHEVCMTLLMPALEKAHERYVERT